MRALIALPLLAFAACQVTTDDQNDSVTVEYNQDVAENGLQDAADKAGEIAGTVANDVEQAAEKVENKAENTDVKIDIDTKDEKSQANAN